jgi:outer membrane protein
MKLFRLLPIVVALGALAAPPARAQSLIDLYEAARAFDATFQSAKSQYEASVAKAEQSRAGILPTVNLGMSAAGNHVDGNVSFPASQFGTQSAAITASQPLYRPANLLAYEQGQKSIVAAQAALLSADQDLVLRVAVAYFDVLAAQANLVFIEAQKTAVAEQLASAKRNFEVGTTTITDTREAQSRYDLVVAQQIAGENDLQVKRLVLAQLVGKADADPKPFAPPLILPPLTPADVNVWVNQAFDENPLLTQTRVALEIAELETKRAQAGHKPTIDLTGSISRAAADGSTSSARNTRVNTGQIAVALNLPLFSGFATQNRIRETLALEDKARTDLEATRRTVATAVRAVFFSVLSAEKQAVALRSAVESSQSSLDANKLGYQVGVRINIDVLNAQSQLFQTQRDLVKVIYDALVGGLRLRQANGTLNIEHLQAINALLVK